MALNEKFFEGHQLPVNVGAGIKSGAPFAVGRMVGVCNIDADGTTNVASVDFHGGVYEFIVDGVNQSGNSAVVVGDDVYFVTGDTIKMSKKNTGVLAGVAIGTAANPSPAAGTTLVASANHVTKILVKMLTF